MYRPSGLTALAVFNFIIAGFYGLSVLGLLVLLANPDKRQPGLTETYIYVNILYAIVDTGLLIIAGVGYLKLKKILGRWLGNIEACFGLAFFAFALSYSLSLGQPFMFSSLKSLIYPGITLILLNVVFRENLVN
ncbi:MAG: hypothetical protein ABI333_11405 [bacterium]